MTLLDTSAFDGRIFTGTPFGAVGETLGEAVFSTGMSGYQETLTDPSYHRQVVVMTAPHVGNTGVNDDDGESRRIWVSGYVVRDPALRPSNWRSQRTLEDDLAEQGIAIVPTLVNIATFPQIAEPARAKFPDYHRHMLDLYARRHDTVRDDAVLEHIFHQVL